MRPAGPPAPLLAACVAVVSLLLAGCTGGTGEPAGGSSPTTSPTASAGASDEASAGPARAAEPPRPQPGACYRLGYQQAIDPVVPRDPVRCGRTHTARTFAVADLPTVVDGHLVAVDSTRAREVPARECPRRVGGFLGGDQEDLRLSMFEAVWFTPTLEEAEAGASWFRCDVVALAADRKLAALEGRLEGVLARPAGDRYGMCSTAKPGNRGFERVVCGRRHSWRAVRVVPLFQLAGEQGRYPGVGAVRTAGQGPCEETGSQEADDPLDFQWGYEWPSRAQWADGTTYGLCWVPD